MAPAGCRPPVMTVTLAAVSDDSDERKNNGEDDRQNGGESKQRSWPDASFEWVIAISS